MDTRFSKPDRVYMGDTLSWNYFALDYLNELVSQGSYASSAYNGYLDQNDLGSASFGALRGAAIAQGLFFALPRLQHFGL